MSGNERTAALTRRDLGAVVAGALAMPQAVAQTPGSATASAGPVLEIADWSYRWYGVEHAKLARGTVCNGMQMYVEHWIPAEVRHPYPVVLIHGGYGQGSEWISTPDGRRGWATQLVEQGFRVYVVDRPGQGRCPYHPYVHGTFDREAPTFERAAASLKAGANDPAVVQYVAALGQPMASNALTQEVWRTRGALLLDDIGPSILITHGDGALWAQLVAQERPNLVKGIASVQPTAQPSAQPGVIPTTAIDSRESLAPILSWIGANVEKGATLSAGIDAHPNKESTALKLADQGGFFVGVQRKTMPYGTIALGQMFVQYMIPAEKRHPYPVVMVHGGGGQGTHMMGLGGRPGWVHYFVQAGYAVYWLDRPSYGRSPYHPDALGPAICPTSRPSKA
jgi:pimeloyl-ACP methyl ester carboxylesterase